MTFSYFFNLFGFSFVSLFTATLIAKDRGSSLLIRLGTSPMKASDFIGRTVIDSKGPNMNINDMLKI